LLSTTEKEVIDSFTKSPIISGLVKIEHPGLSDMFRKMCLTCMVVSGIKSQIEESPIDNVTEGFLWNYITKHYGNFTFDEIEKAFYFNSIGKLEHRIEHFGLFDTTFVSKVLTEWLILKNKTRGRISQLLPKKAETPPVTAEESYSGLVAYCQKLEGFPEFWAWSLVYDHMTSLNLIPESKDERWDLYYAELERLEAQMIADIGKIKNVYESNKIRESLPEQAKQNCMKNLVKKHLKF
jgi:hypothetical protein